MTNIRVIANIYNGKSNSNATNDSEIKIKSAIITIVTDGCV